MYYKDIVFAKALRTVSLSYLTMITLQLASEGMGCALC